MGRVDERSKADEPMIDWYGLHVLRTAAQNARQLRALKYRKVRATADKRRQGQVRRSKWARGRLHVAGCASNMQPRKSGHADKPGYLQDETVWWSGSLMPARDLDPQQAGQSVCTRFVDVRTRYCGF